MLEENSKALKKEKMISTLKRPTEGFCTVKARSQPLLQLLLRLVGFPLLLLLAAARLAALRPAAVADCAAGLSVAGGTNETVIHNMMHDGLHGLRAGARMKWYSRQTSRVAPLRQESGTTSYVLPDVLAQTSSMPLNTIRIVHETY
jgi:hypothetical protein